MESPRVLVGCPTSYHKEYALEKYIESVKSLSYGNFDFILVDNSEGDNYYNKINKLLVKVIKGPYFEGARDRIVASRNILRKYALDNGYDYFLSLEQDVIPPKDIIERLLKHDKDIVSGVYFVHNIINDRRVLVPLAYVIWDGDEDEEMPAMRPLNDQELWSDELVKAVSFGLGCVLMHRNVLDKIEFRYNKDTEAFDDRWFFIDLFKMKQDVYVDASIKCKHLIGNRPFPWKNIKK